MNTLNMEKFTDYIPFIIRPNVADEYLHRVGCGLIAIAEQQDKDDFVPKDWEEV